MIKLASWNVNSLKIRKEQVLDWLERTGTDILALQETKLIDEQFPVSCFTDRGYHIAFSGQPTYNGVAIISKFPIEEVLYSIPNFMDPQRRILAATIQDIRIINLYVPNGSAVDSSKYLYKCDWLEKVTEWIKEQLRIYPKVAVVGDFNIAPDDRDVHDPALWEGSVLVSPKEREALQSLLQLGLVDSFREFPVEEKLYSWWDYRAAAFRRNMGLRIDLILLNDVLRSACTGSWIDREMRKVERPSDHAPVWIEIG